MNFDVQLTFGDLLSLLLAIVLVFVMGLVAQWILGVHRGFWRAFVSGLIGWGAGVALSNAIFQDVDSVDDLWRTGAASLGFSLLATMLAGIVIDVIVRPRDQRNRRLLRIYHPVGRSVGAWRSPAESGRSSVRPAPAASSGGRSHPARWGGPDNALKLRQTLEDCGGMFVKFGQIASTRSDLLPPALIEELSNLRSEVRPLPPEVVATVIIDGLGMPEDEAFQSFEQEPLAAASIGQIHRARRHDGKAVVVKVQRPAVPESVRRDAAVLRWAARTVERRSDSARRIGVRGFADELIGGLEEELDFTREAANGLLLKRACERIEGVEAPRSSRTRPPGRSW